MSLLYGKMVSSFVFIILTGWSHKISSFMTPAETGHTYLALGDSYTIGQSVNAYETYPAQTVAYLNSQKIVFNSPEIIATTGWTTGDLLNAINKYKFHFAKYDVVTLSIGVNNQYQGRSKTEYDSQFREILQKAIQLAGNILSHVVVLSIPDYSVTPFAQNSDTALIAKEINSFNIINKGIAAEYKVNYLDITDESRKTASDPNLITHDHLHYSGKEYAIWARMLTEMIKRNLK